MTVVGHSRPNWAIWATSAFPLIATKLRTSPDVRSVPDSDLGRLTRHVGSIRYSPNPLAGAWFNIDD